MTETADNSLVPAVYGYHAHVYYSAATKPAAERLARRLNATFDV